MSEHLYFEPATDDVVAVMQAANGLRDTEEITLGRLWLSPEFYAALGTAEPALFGRKIPYAS